MLRIDPGSGTIPTDFDDNYLELIRLLTAGAGIEHSLMIAYLYALFSIKPEYAYVQGDVSPRSYLEHSPVGRGGTAVLRKKTTFLDVAIEEMQHLALVNKYLAELGAAPCFVPLDLPYSSGFYPFDLELCSLDRYAAATFLWIEADTCALSLSPKCEPTREPLAFVHEVRKTLRAGEAIQAREGTSEQTGYPDHVGSLYRRIIQQTQRVAAAPPAFLPADFPWGEWEEKMSWITYQGEIAHYQFFRRVFTGEAFHSDAGIWTPGPRYPAYVMPWKTAYAGHKAAIANPDARALAWLGDLHYWIILTLLDTAYRAPELKLQYKAIDNMTSGLWLIGRHLASQYGVGMPFDAIGPQYTLGRTNARSIEIIRKLVLEAQGKAEALGARGLLPEGYSLELFPMTLAGLALV
ncbi:MAG TPA: ferritin-like domain-containing protein [Kofleriaceae bacterium]|jgi:hypothetical protein|nr:ferritin-like domain-containing protein [Kofleriaceae bacterium]